MTATTGYLARERSGVTPRFEAYEGDDPIKYAISLNLVRRRLDETQRTMVAAKLSNLARGGNRGNQYTGGKASIDVLPDAIAAALENLGEGRPVKTASFLAVSQEEAANSLNISERSIGRARTVYRDGSKAQ